MKTNSLTHYPEIAKHLQKLNLSEKQVNVVIREGCRCIYETHRNTDEDRQRMLAGSMAEKIGQSPDETWKALADAFYVMFAIFLKVYRKRTAIPRSSEQRMRRGILEAWRHQQSEQKHEQSEQKHEQSEQKHGAEDLTLYIS